LDIHTLHIEHVTMLVLYTALTFLNFRMHRSIAGITWFLGYGLCLCAGASLVMLRGHIPNEVSIFVGDLMFPIGYVFLHRSMTGFFDRGSAQLRIQIGFVGIAILGLIQYGLLEPNTRYRLLAFSAVLGVQLAMTAYFVARNTPGFMRAAGGVMSAILALLSLSDMIRFVDLLFQDAPANYLRGGPLLAWTVLDNSVLQGGVIIAYVWMTAARLHHDIEVHALTDPLTGLLNRRAIEMSAKRAIASSERNLRPVSAILFDLDKFKSINDSFGHPCGDAVLVAIAGCLAEQTRQQDLSARLGGDEFAVLLPETHLDTAFQIAERLCATIAQLRVPHASRTISVRASFGVAELRDIAQLQDVTQGWEMLMSSCDRALYSVKSKGGNLVSVGALDPIDQAA
jgi:diguanylate cyclase (GGDEF)-like protein